MEFRGKLIDLDFSPVQYTETENHLVSIHFIWYSVNFILFTLQNLIVSEIV